MAASKTTPIYTRSDVIYFVRSRLRVPVSDSTFKRWRKAVEVEPDRVDGEWLYTQSDIDALVTIGRWLKAPGATVKGFQKHYKIGDFHHG